MIGRVQAWLADVVLAYARNHTADRQVKPHQHHRVVTYAVATMPGSFHKTFHCFWSERSDRLVTLHRIPDNARGPSNPSMSLC